MSGIALAVALFAIRRGNRNASASTIIVLNESFRQAWTRFLSAVDEQSKEFEFSELMKLFEITCDIYLEDSLSGVSREPLEEYVGNTLSLLEANDDARERMDGMVHSPTTFKYIRRFLERMRKAGSPYRLAGKKRADIGLVDTTTVFSRLLAKCRRPVA